MAHKKGAGSTKNGRDSNSKRSGFKYGTETVKSGEIIVPQPGLTFKPGKGVTVGKDYTLVAVQDGIVNYERDPSDGRIYVNVLDRDDPWVVSRLGPPRQLDLEEKDGM